MTLRWICRVLFVSIWISAVPASAVAQQTRDVVIDKATLNQVVSTDAEAVAVLKDFNRRLRKMGAELKKAETDLPPQGNTYRAIAVTDLRRKRQAYQDLKDERNNQPEVKKYTGIVGQTIRLHGEQAFRMEAVAKRVAVEKIVRDRSSWLFGSAPGLIMHVWPAKGDACNIVYHRTPPAPGKICAAADISIAPGKVQAPRSRASGLPNPGGGSGCDPRTVGKLFRCQKGGTVLCQPKTILANSGPYCTDGTLPVRR